jgi:hypothetical protein
MPVGNPDEDGFDSASIFSVTIESNPSSSGFPTGISLKFACLFASCMHDHSGTDAAQANFRLMPVGNPDEDGFDSIVTEKIDACRMRLAEFLGSSARRIRQASIFSVTIESNPSSSGFPTGITDPQAPSRGSVTEA